jgi:hypothetical protein
LPFLAEEAHEREQEAATANKKQKISDTDMGDEMADVAQDVFAEEGRGEERRQATRWR